MNTLQFDQGTMAGMTDGHFIASVEPLLMTLLEKELFKRLVEHETRSDLIRILEAAGFDNATDLQNLLNAPKCPGGDVLDGSIDDALYLIDQTSGEAREVATKLHECLTTLQKDLK
jgi:hypothetical protein